MTKRARTEPTIAEFVQTRVGYYERAFARIENASGFVWGFNPAASLFGPLWAAWRGLWGFFALSAFAELAALTQLARGLFGDLGADSTTRAAKLAAVAAARTADANVAMLAGDTAGAATFHRIAANLTRASELALAEAHGAMAAAPGLALTGALALCAVKLAEGILANPTYERRYASWRSDRAVASGSSTGRLAVGLLLVIAAYPLTVYRFTAAHVPDWLVHVPSNRQVFSTAAAWIDALFEGAYRSGSGGFDGVRDGLRGLVHVLDTVLVQTPWPVVMVVLLGSAWRLAGTRVALLTAAGIAYLALLGLWEPAMQTVALLGTSAVICVAIGIPLGILLSRSERAQAAARPVLDLMQTMPALVYLIPAIAFFGTGTPPGVIATLIFGLPPVVRLTTLGLRQVPEHVKEAARAYGATPRQLLFGVELPLARASIMAGVNQTILMCLSMVVVAALIGAQGLGSIVLEALQYAASGQGVLAGLAILLCAVVIDRIVQATFRPRRAADSH